MMPVRYERDDARRRVVVTVQGEFQTGDMLTVAERPLAEETSGYGMLFDLRRMTGPATPGDLRRMIDQAAAARPAEPRRGPVAIVATDPILYRVACTYAALGHAKLAIQVCRDLDEADLWLAAW
jgi:hypothetical protein